MKKLVGSIMTLSLLTSVSSTVVACARGPRMQQIVTKYNKTKVGDVDYDESQMNLAFNGSNMTLYGAREPLKTLSRNILNLLGFNQSLVTQRKSIPRFREFYMGSDSTNKENISAAASVDGIFYGDFIGLSQDAFYNQYNNTHINSIAGLYDLYLYNENHPGVVTANGAADSLAVIADSFSNNQAVTQQFIDSFLGLDDKNNDSAWISQKYNFDESLDLSQVKLDSFVTPFDEVSTTEDQKTTNRLIFGGEKNLGQPTNFPDFNTTIEATPEAKIGDNKSEPFNLLLLPPTDLADVKNSSIEATFDLSWTYDKEKADGTNYWDIRKPTDSEGWKFRATEAQISEDEAPKIEIGYIKTNESMVVPLQPLKVQYEYSTNARNDNATKYLINLTIDGLYAVFNPIRYLSSFKDQEADAKKYGNRFIKWQFSHYQFNDINNVNSLPGSKKSVDPGNGYFSGMKIIDMTVQKA